MIIYIITSSTRTAVLARWYSILYRTNIVILSATQHDVLLLLFCVLFPDHVL